MTCGTSDDSRLLWANLGIARGHGNNRAQVKSECDPCQEDTGMEFGRCLGHSDRTWQLSSVMGIEWLGEGDYRCTELLLSMYS